MERRIKHNYVEKNLHNPAYPLLERILNVENILQ